jgi:hypothetical protein
MFCMRRAACTFVMLALLFTASICARAADCIHTSDTQVCVTSTESAPRLLSFGSLGERVWDIGSSEKLIEFAEVDGRTVKLDWKLQPALTRREGRFIQYVFEAAQPHLRVYWEWESRAEFGPVEHRIRIENRGDSTVLLPLQSSLQFSINNLPAGTRLENWYVEKGADTPSPQGTHRDFVKDGYDWNGFSSTYAHPVDGRPREIIPWMLVHDDSGARGFYAGVEFSGRLRLDLARKRSVLNGSLGLDPEPGPYRTRLAPSAKFETPTVFLSAFHGDPDSASNTLRRWVRAVFGSQETWKDQHYPWATNNSWGSGTDVNEAVAKRMIHDSAELGLEMFHLDAGWFRAVGDWTPDPKKFPHGLAPIADEAHRAGLKFGLWIDWAQAGTSTAPGALNVNDAKVHDWLVTDLPANWKPEEFKGQTIDIGVPDAKAWAEKELDRVSREFKLDMLEHDGYLVTQGCVRDDHPHVPPDPVHTSIQKDAGFLFAYSRNSTDVSYHSTRSYYAIYERLRREHPGMLLEICNDGGRMVDFGSAAHGDYFSITDTYDPLSNRRAFYDTSWVLPPAMLESYVEKFPTPTLDNFRYMLRSGMMGWLSVMQDTTAWSSEQHDAARREIEIYKTRLRPLIRDANLYHVSDRPDGVHWDAIQFMDPQQKEGVLFVFRGSGSEGSHVFKLRGLDPKKKYLLEYEDRPSLNRQADGAELTSRGVTLTLPGPNSSELVFIHRVSSSPQASIAQ